MSATPVRSVLLAAAVATAAPLALTSTLDARPATASLVTAVAAAPGETTTTVTRPPGSSTTSAAPSTTGAPTTAAPAPPPPPPTTMAAPSTTVDRAPATTTAPPPPPPTTAAAPSPPPPPPKAQTSTSSCTSQFASWINQARANNGVGAVSADGGIAYIPTNWSKSMADRGRLAHNPSYAEQIRRERPQASSWAENVGVGPNGARGVFDSFMASSSHRARILDGSKTHAAAGCSIDGSGQTWVALDLWG